MKHIYTTEELLALEQNIVNELLTFFNNEYNFDKIIYTDWTAKDILAHIVMWHESFANNISALINNDKPKLLKGLLYKINENGVKEYKKYTIEELKEKLKTAQDKINANIENKKIELVPYRKESKRKYTKDEHLEIVYKHIKGHYNDIIKMYK
ncbi:MAG: hypothetical protein Pg6A_11810 [Termitinemataceae bacterium]|nr:MAG: hypothetical protein Pg6A_11810 [Termitinemataceae bacterium]